MSAQITITFPDGKQKQFAPGTTSLEVAKSISEGLARNCISAKVNGEVFELIRPITTDAKIELLTWDHPDGKMTFWHSSAHILAEAIQFFYPDAALAIGPPIENGFYYDIDFQGKPFSSEEFKKIEDKFLELSASGEVFRRENMTKA